MPLYVHHGIQVAPIEMVSTIEYSRYVHQWGGAWSSVLKGFLDNEWISFKYLNIWYKLTFTVQTMKTLWSTHEHRWIAVEHLLRFSDMTRLPSSSQCISLQSKRCNLMVFNSHSQSYTVVCITDKIINQSDLQHKHLVSTLNENWLMSTNKLMDDPK
jgi:hypothetical protein